MGAVRSQLPRVGSWVPSAGICRSVTDRQIRFDLPEPPRGSARPPGGRDLRTLLATLSAGILHRGERMAALRLDRRWFLALCLAATVACAYADVTEDGDRHPVFNTGVGATILYPGQS